MSRSVISKGIALSLLCFISVGVTSQTFGQKAVSKSNSQSQSSEIDAWVKFMESKVQVASPLQDIKVERDGDNDGVLLEFTYEEDAKVGKHKLDSRNIAMYVFDEEMTEDDIWKQNQSLFEADNYMRIVSKSSDGKVLADTKLTKDAYEEFMEEADELNDICDELIVGGKSETDSLSDSDIFESADVRRLQGFGVLFEYVYAPGVSVDESMLTEDLVREAIVGAYKGNDATWDQIVEIMDRGITMTFTYKYSDGKVISETVISKHHMEEF